MTNLRVPEQLPPPTSQGWEKESLTNVGDSVFSADDIINAYFHGRRDQMNSDFLLKIKKLEANLRKAESLSEHLFEFIKKMGFKCETVFLKIKDVYSYTSLFLIDEDDYCHDDFLNVYKETIRVKKENNNSQTFDFSTILTPYNAHFDKNCLVTDGYILSYNGQLH